MCIARQCDPRVVREDRRCARSITFCDRSWLFNQAPAAPLHVFRLLDLLVHPEDGKGNIRKQWRKAQRKESEPSVHADGFNDHGDKNHDAYGGSNRCQRGYDQDRMLALWHCTAARDCREDLSALDCGEGPKDSPEHAWSCLVNTNDDHKHDTMERTYQGPLQKQYRTPTRRQKGRPQ